jgi:hypothetical protein
LQRAEQLGRQYKDKPYNPDTQKALGIDKGFGSSKTAFTIIEYVDGIIHVIYSKAFEDSSTEQMVAHAYKLIRQYRLDAENSDNRTFVDGSASGWIRSLKTAIGEYPKYEVFVEKSKRDKIDLWRLMKVVPVNFGEHGRVMLGNVKKWIDMCRVAIDSEQFPELMTDLRIATSDEEMALQKDDYKMDLIHYGLHLR